MFLRSPGSFSPIINETTGYLVNYGNLKKIVHLIIKLKDNPDLRKTMGYQGRMMVIKKYKKSKFIGCQEEPKNMGAWNTVRNYIERTLEMINYGDKSVKYVGRKAASSTATGNFNKHLAQQKEILEKIVKD